MLKPFIFFIGSALVLSLFSCQRRIEEKPPDDKLVILQFRAKVGSEDVSSNRTFTNSFGEDFEISRLQFYVHGLEFTNTQTGHSYQHPMDEHKLITSIGPGTIDYSLRFSGGHFNQLSFKLGVDSVRNFSGAQTNDLDPAKGMFWTWNSGYIMFKMEGTSPVANTPGNVFEYHIGGFTGENNVVRKITLPLGETINFSSEPKVFNIDLDVLKIFDGPNEIRLANDPVSVMPGPLAVKVANNYAEIFSVHPLN